MIDKVIEQFKLGYSTVPNMLLQNYKKLNISDSELILVIYLLNYDKSFNPQKIASDLSFELPAIMQMIDNLMNNDLISINVIKKNGVSTEYLDTDNIYKKLAYLLINEKEEVKKENSMFDLFEKEFGRPLSTIEYELINAWSDSGYTEELITQALKEAVYNGVFNLKYIDRILYQWGKKELKTKEDVENDKANFRSQKEKKELFDYDWLSDPDVRDN